MLETKGADIMAEAYKKETGALLSARRCHGMFWEILEVKTEGKSQWIQSGDQQKKERSWKFLEYK